MLMTRLTGWARVLYKCEVFNLFAHFKTQEGLNRMEGGRKRQGLVPDFLMEIEKERGQEQLGLAELKSICCFPESWRPERGVQEEGLGCK